jgi:ubiquinone/menaquinone biosynthesis C-methylase UbiE
MEGHFEKHIRVQTSRPGQHNELLPPTTTFIMSLRGRYIIDRIKRAVGDHFRLPCPPYGDPQYWDNAYASFGPQDSYEWGDVSLDDVYEYKYHPIEWDPIRHSTSSSNKRDHTKVQLSTLAAALKVNPLAEKDQPLLMVGCGNSKFGEDMVGRGWRGPIIQVDVSSRIVDSMSQRCGDLISNGHMNFVQDDATELSAFRDGMMDACLDKGLLDAIFCADEYTQMVKISNTVNRVLRPGGSFVFFSFSRPEFFLPKLLISNHSPPLQQGNTRKTKRLWSNLEVHKLGKILLYKMEKVGGDEGYHKGDHVSVRMRPRSGNRTVTTKPQ